MALREFQEKKNVRRLIFSLPVAILVVILSLWAAYGTVSAVFTWRELSKKNRELESKIDDIKKSKEALEEKIKLIETEYGVDLEARENFNLKKPGEQIILFVEE
ncbi:MAG: septum formation initiator family protein [Patescibacteria group bacterium]